MNITVRELIRLFKGELILGDPKGLTRRAVVDSRVVEKGDLFFALKGDRTDGHHFAMSAANAGASGLVVSNLDWMRHRQEFFSSVILVEDPLASLQLLSRHLRGEFNGPVIGITGSNGKTTTKQMVASIMGTMGSGLFTKGNLNSQIGLPLMMSEVSPSDQWMVLEMGASEPGNISQLADLAKPKYGVITSIGPAHLKTFGSVEKIASSKWELIESLPFDGVGIVPWGEPLLDSLVRSSNNRLVFFGEDSACPVRASALELGSHVRFQLHLSNDHTLVELPLSGRFNVTNALAAAAVGWVLGRPLEAIAQALQNFEPPRMRMEVSWHPSGATLINDAYNANPASMILSVRSMAESYPESKRIVVLGSMLELGEDSDRMHFHLGTELAKFSLEQIYLFGEEMKQTLEGGLAAGEKSEKFFHSMSHVEIAERLKKHLTKGTVVLFKGSRSTKMEKVIEQLNGVPTPQGRT